MKHLIKTLSIMIELIGLTFHTISKSCKLSRMQGLALTVAAVGNSQTSRKVSKMAYLNIIKLAKLSKKLKAIFLRPHKTNKSFSSNKKRPNKTNRLQSLPCPQETINCWTKTLKLTSTKTHQSTLHLGLTRSRRMCL